MRILRLLVLVALVAALSPSEPPARAQQPPTPVVNCTILANTCRSFCAHTSDPPSCFGGCMYGGGCQ